MITTYIYWDLKRLDKHGRLAIRISLTIDRQTQRSTLFKIFPKHWDEKRLMVKISHPEHKALNKVLSSKLSIVRESINNNLVKPGAYLKEILTGKSMLKIQHAAAVITYFDEYRSDLIYRRKYEYERKVKNSWDKVRSYYQEHHKINPIEFKDDMINILDINEYFMKKFIAWLETSKTLKGSTIKNVLKDVRAVLDLADLNNQQVDKTAKKQRVHSGRTTKEKLSNEEFEKIKNIILPDGQRIELTRDLFVLAIYLRGKRISDMLTLKEEDIQNERTFLNEIKTKKDTNLEILPEAQVIIDKYRGQSKYGYVLPFLTQPKIDLKKAPIEACKSYKKNISAYTAVVNKNLKIIALMAEINKKLTSHVARHTFAAMCKRAGLPIYVIQQLLELGSLNVCERYISELMRDEFLDSAAKYVFSEAQQSEIQFYQRNLFY